MGEGELDFKFLPAGGQFHLCGSDEALTPYGGLVAWDHFLEGCKVITDLAANYPLLLFNMVSADTHGFDTEKLAKLADLPGDMTDADGTVVRRSLHVPVIHKTPGPDRKAVA